MKKYHLVELLLRWLLSWASLVDGILGILTFGLYLPSLAYKSAVLLARWQAIKKLRIK